MPRALLFDVDGVLLHSMFHADPERCRRWDQHLLEDLGVSPEAFRQFFSNDFGRVIRGQSSLVARLEKFLPSIGYKKSPLDFIAYWFKNDTHLNTQLLDAIRNLARSTDVVLYLATNQEHLRAFHLWNVLGLSHTFNDMFYAARIGAAKPDKAYFKAVDVLLGPQVEPPLFFDDCPKNIDAASAHGWEATHFNDLNDFTNHTWVMANTQPNNVG